MKAQPSRACIATAACALFALQALAQSGPIIDATTSKPVEPNQALLRAAAAPDPGNWSFGTGGRIYVCDSNQDLLFTLDPESGASTLVGSTGLNGLGTPADLTWNGKNLLTIDLAGGELFSLDLESGMPTLVGNTGLNGWQGLAADPTDNGQLYAMNQSGAFYRLAPDGTPQQIAGGVQFPGGSLIATLAFDADGQLWASDFFAGQFGTIDKESGATTQVGTTINGIQGWDFDDDGRLWAESSNTDSLYRINTSTGEATLVGPDGLDFVKGLAIITSGGECDPCDANCDGVVDAFDIEPFISLLVGPGTPCSSCAADTNGDGAVDAFDIEPFINCLVGP